MGCRRKSDTQSKTIIFYSSENIDFREKEDNVPYSELAEQGFVEFCDGKLIDQEQIFHFIEDCMDFMMFNKSIMIQR